MTNNSMDNINKKTSTPRENETDYQESKETNSRNQEETMQFIKTKKLKLDTVPLDLDNLPFNSHYERSLMHRDVVNFVFTTPTDFLLTTSIDGHVKFWKKTLTGIEFVKQFKSHLGAIVSATLSFDGLLFATVGVDKTVDIFDVLSFDMIQMIKLDFLPNTLCWTFKKQNAHQALLAISDKESGRIFFYDGRECKGNSALFTIDSIHSHPVHLLAYHPIADVVVSVDTSGMMEYWVPNKEFQSIKPNPWISWEFKSDTDLYDFKKVFFHSLDMVPNKGWRGKTKNIPNALIFSPNWTFFATFGFSHGQLLIFSFKTGKIIKRIDESLESISNIQNKTKVVDDMEFARRLALEKEILKSRSGQVSSVNILFDETGNVILYPTLYGIKMVHIHTNKVLGMIGNAETIRFMNIALYQGKPKKKGLVTLEMAASDNTVYKESESTDPTVYATGFKKNRFYCISTRDPEVQESSDIFNEKPTREEVSTGASSIAIANQVQSNKKRGNNAILHTQFGDIHICLFPEYAPKAVENFIRLAKKGYYDDIKFHRCIKGFMIQTGDPNGDGSGGESIWGHDFEDEIHPALKLDKPYSVAMANMGPNTNGSQFFITVAPTPWLEGKHTVFGRCTGGMDVVHKIENVRTNYHHRPDEPVRIHSIEFD